jgi:hypothetical protein
MMTWDKREQDNPPTAETSDGAATAAVEPAAKLLDIGQAPATTLARSRAGRLRDLGWAIL